MDVRSRKISQTQPPLYTVPFITSFSGYLLKRMILGNHRTHCTRRPLLFIPKSQFDHTSFPTLQRNASLIARHIHSQVTIVRRRATEPRRPYLFGLTGVAGSSKTTTAKLAADLLNSKIFPRLAARVLGMDGFHYYRHELDQFPNSKEAYKRRGAPWTFNAHRFVKTLQTLWKEGCCVAPSFDHSRGDPEEGSTVIDHTVSAVIVEGNYLLLDTEPWSEAKDLLDEVWFLQVDQEEADRRVVRRHVREMGLTWKDAQLRVTQNDRPNAKLINETKSRANFILHSDT